MPNVLQRLQHGWNAFLGRDPTKLYTKDYGPSSSVRPDHFFYYGSGERSIVMSIKNRIAMDAASVDIRHVRNDEDGNYQETLSTGLNEVLGVEANVDQTGRELIKDVILSMFDEGVVAVVPTDTTIDPTNSNAYDVVSMRTAQILQWYPKHVKLKLYNERTGQKEEIILPKKMVAIIENPLYAVMNEPNSTMQRLVRTIYKLDLANENNASGKLDLIIQLPYVIKSDARRQQAEARRKDIEMQLTGSKYGIAYTDGTERITQLNRAVENNLWTQVKELTSMLNNQLGLTESVFDGTADDKVMANYYSRTVYPVVKAVTEEMERKFLSKTARTQGQAIRYFRNPFDSIPLGGIAEVANVLMRNGVTTANEIRASLGYKPSDNEMADQLINANIGSAAGEVIANKPSEENQNE